MFIFLFVIYACVPQKKIEAPLSPIKLLQDFKNSDFPAHCIAWELSGIFYVFSPKQNFRAHFYLKGNSDFPWKMEIRWGMGALISVTQIRQHEIILYSIKENSVYKIKNPDNVFLLLGLKNKISPLFYLKVLTGEWKNFISTPKKIVPFDKGFRYLFENKLFSELELEYNLKNAKIKLKSGGEILIIGGTKIVFNYKKVGKIIFRIKKKNCLNIRFTNHELDIAIPEGVNFKYLN